MGAVEPAGPSRQRSGSGMRSVIESAWNCACVVASSDGQGRSASGAMLERQSAYSARGFSGSARWPSTSQRKPLTKSAKPSTTR
jgi:hypothetical protein